MTLREQAIKRVEEFGLGEYYDILIDTDWPEGDEHYRWILTSCYKGLLDWCETTREQLSQLES